MSGLSSEVQAALIAGVFSFVGGVAIALITSFATIRKTLRDQLDGINDNLSRVWREIDKINTQLGPLWNIYGVDAIREARKGNLVIQNSPLRTSGAWQEVIPETVRAEVKKRAVAESDVDENALAQTIVAAHLDELYHVSVEYDLSIRAILGATMIRIRELRRTAAEGK